MKTRIPFALALLLGACFGNREAPLTEELMPGEDVRLEGRVLEVDATPMFVDGDGEITLRTGSYGRVLVRVPARERQCRAQGLDIFPSLAEGDSLRVVGHVTAPGEVTVCTEDTHRLERVD